MAKERAARARQGSALPRQGKARLRSKPHRLSEARPEPRFAPRRHSTDATCTATAWTGYAPQGRCSEPQSCGTALDSLARHRHGKGSWGNALPRHSAAFMETQNTAADEHCVARHRQSIASHCIEQRGLSSPKRRSGLVRLRTAMAMNSSVQRRDGTALDSAAMARNRTASANQSHATQSGGRAVNLCARD